MSLSPEERELCQQLRNRLSDLATDDFRLMDFNIFRFLRARNMNLDRAEETFRKFIEWREQNDIDNAMSWPIARDLKDNFVYRVTGLARNGGLVICVNIGDWDPGICYGRYEELLMLAYHELEHLSQIAKYFILKANSFSKMVAIINLEGLTFAHCSTKEWIRALSKLLKAFESYYPGETLKRAYLLAAPWVFSILWSIAKPFISKATHERLHFLKKDRKLWKKEFQQFVALDQIPESLGGTLPNNYQLVLNEDGTVEGKIVNRKIKK